MNQRDIIIYTDGGISPVAAGAAIVVADHTRSILSIASKTLPQMTNNEAEYAALIMALKAAAALGVEVVQIRMDSEVVVYQMAGRFAVNSPRLKPLHRDACALARGIPRISYRHISRGENLLADALATEAIAGREWRMG